MSENKFLPEDVRTEKPFGDSEFKNCETEIVARNVVIIQEKINPKAWTPFSFEDYKELCTHNVSDSEKGVLEALVFGGSPVMHTSAVLESGYLMKNGEKYSITEKFLNALEEFRKN